MDAATHLGWSYHGGEPLLIFELMPNGSLDQHLFHLRTPILLWETHYGIVRDIATGLHYVHHEYEPTVLHRDIKTSNVLLNSTFGARLGDFGIACTVPLDRNSVTGLARTQGYIAPEYACSYRATRETLIYAFGVVVLEIVTGRPADGRSTGMSRLKVTSRTGYGVSIGRESCSMPWILCLTWRGSTMMTLNA